MEYLDVVIIDLFKGDKSDKIRDYDFIYGGKGEVWLKFVYGLKVCYIMYLLVCFFLKEVDL